jgi:uncharacterized repeat protein (TIGR01451 family)
MKKIIPLLISVLFFSSLNAQYNYVGTYAGTNSVGFVNGALSAARFNNPYGVAFDGVNTIYVADLYNHAIRAINMTTGTVSTLAGTGSAGFVNGIGTSASFNAPAGVFYKDGFLYVADDFNQAIRKIDLSNDSVSTVAGSGSSGFQDGPALTAKFYEPKGLAVDDSGIVYVADYGNNRIRKISGGVVSTFAGTGTSGSANGALLSATFSWPRDLCFDNLGNMYVTDILNNKIRRIANGTVSTLAGSGAQGGTDGTGSSASFYSPVGIVYKNGALYVVDGAGNKVRKVTLNGVVTTIAGTGASGYANGACNTSKFNLPQGLTIDNAGNIYVGDKSNNSVRIIGTTNNSIGGDVFKDQNSNCSFASGDSYLANRLVLATPGSYYASTDNSGHYSLPLPAGTYTISQIITNPTLWDTVCPSGYTQSLTLTTGNNVNNVNFALHPKTNCPVLWVDLGASALRRCMTNSYSVNYCNKGTDSASNVYIDITVDSLMTINNSNLTYTQTGSTYRFNVGTLDAEECGYFWFTVYLDCAASTGSTHCVSADIGPATNCYQVIDSTWDKSSLSVSGNCNDSLACFTILNTGSASNGNMQGTSPFRIYENGILVNAGTIQLAGGADTVICWPANGNTIQLQADQRPGHPGHSHPNDYVEECGTPGGTSPVFGIVTSIAPDDADNEIEIECLQVISSFDPNDKTVIPAGITDEHYIKNNDELEYRIRFQNTGNDTAFNIVVIDTLPGYLDPATVVSGVSSNPYEFEMIGNGILKWTFRNILLPDSTTNEPGSHGFVKFKIEQKQGNAPGTRIENKVGIYFDFNSPVITNTAFSTVWQDLVLTVQKKDLLSDFNVYPNPSAGVVCFESKAEIVNGNLVIMDASGRIIKQQKTEKTKTTIDLSSCAKGIYFYSIRSNNGVVSSGKIIVR